MRITRSDEGPGNFNLVEEYKLKDAEGYNVIPSKVIEVQLPVDSAVFEGNSISNDHELLLLEQQRYLTNVEVTGSLKEWIFNHFKKKLNEIQQETELGSYNLGALKTARGNLVLQKYSHSELNWSIEVEFDESILIWHIATEICCKLEDSAGDIILSKHHISKLLSEYMLYLLVMNPSMFPVGMGQFVFEDTCAEAVRFFSTAEKLDVHRNLLKQYNTGVQQPGERYRSKKSVLSDACRLAQQLVDISDKEQKYFVLPVFYFQSSFIGDSEGHHPIDGDIEMGIRGSRSNPDMGMEAFNKKIQEVGKQLDKINGLLKNLKITYEFWWTVVSSGLTLFGKVCLESKLQKGSVWLRVQNLEGDLGHSVADLLVMISLVREANEDSKSVTKASAMKAIKKRMEKDVDEVGKIARNVKERIIAINKDNLDSRQKPGCEKGTGVDRARMNVTNAITKRFRDLMTEFQTLRQKIQDEYRELVERRVITVTGTRPDQKTIDHLIETGNSEQIFQKAIQEQGRGEVLNTLEEIQERHDAVKEIEKKLLELKEIFGDLAVLVDAQGEILDNIENQVANAVTHVPVRDNCISNCKETSEEFSRMDVTNAVDHVHNGTDALRTARNLQKKSRKCMMIAIILVLIIAIIIVLSILKPWKKN
ncbi:hypothetical protein POTOM_027583 [Populus tomentosa]|uniref:t-SNARE coiled-coil homology domain-containing protein n=1 Tax=Populus tomentosa TaxID=118781 RepID=A0A8X7ZGG6_POPTO|nr:hypothetical protein POTOM_027583 [Populus tomentosa]